MDENNQAQQPDDDVVADRRISWRDVEMQIASETYFTAAEGEAGAKCDGTQAVAVDGGPLSLLTFCVIRLHNGYIVTGESICLMPEYFDADLGRMVARDKAIAKIAPLLAFRICDRY